MVEQRTENPCVPGSIPGILVFSQDCSDILISVTHTDCDSYEWNGNILDISGEYVYTTTLANGCDSIVTLDLTINESFDTTFFMTACNEYVFEDSTFTESGNYVYTSSTLEGCVYTANITLTIENSSQSSNETVTACNSYEWNGDTYTESGTYTFEDINENGCTSTDTL